MYDTLAKGYEELYGEEQEKKLEKVAYAIKGRILDIGAGTGIVARRYSNVVSLEPSLEMLKQAKGMCVLGFAENLPFKQRSFDTIVSLTALHHTDISQVITEIKKLQAKNFVFTILKKSAHCEEIVSQLQKAFNLEIIEEEKDFLLVKQVKY